MKIRLLNCDGYVGMEYVKFPAEVDAEVVEVAGGVLAIVPESEMHRIGCSDAFSDPDDPVWPFCRGSWEAV